LIEKSYQLLDENIGEICACAGADTAVFIISDHGFGPLEKRFYVNRWLAQEGLARFRKPRRSPWLFIFPLLKAGYRVLEVGDYLGLRRKMFWKFLKSKFMEEGKSFHQMPHEFFEWSRTFAYSNSETEQGIRINLKGREPEGIVEPAEYEKNRGLIIDKLRKIKDPETGESLGVKVYKREEIYQGPYLEYAPVLVFSVKEGAYVSRVRLFKKIFEKINKASGLGSHRTNGIFIARGKEISKDRVAHGHIFDLLPTILYLMGITIPDDVDGRILREIFTADFIQKNQPRYKKSEAQPSAGEEAEKVLSREEDELIKERLKNLGYM
jgi:predicted AlkP superfamily phosphohydrolase/phosphomutase